MNSEIEGGGLLYDAIAPEDDREDPSAQKLRDHAARSWFARKIEAERQRLADDWVKV